MKSGNANLIRTIIDKVNVPLVNSTYFMMNSHQLNFKFK